MIQLQILQRFDGYLMIEIILLRYLVLERLAQIQLRVVSGHGSRQEVLFDARQGALRVFVSLEVAFIDSGIHARLSDRPADAWQRC